MYLRVLLLTILIQRVLECISKYQDNFCLYTVNNVMGRKVVIYTYDIFIILYFIGINIKNN